MIDHKLDGLFSWWEPESVKKLNANAEKQRRYRDRQKLKGKREIRGYVSPEAQQCYDDLAEKSGWTDSELLTNALRITYAAYKCGQIKLLNEWLKNHKR